MVFVSKNPIRKCKWCGKPAKLNRLKNGRNKGYFRTCGSRKCLKAQYKSTHVSRKKGRILNGKERICLCCNEKFISLTANHKFFCKECVPNKQWKNKARLYLVGKKKWDELLHKQNGTCALCSRNPDVIDHCHKLKIVRGLLCQKCNMAMSIIDDDIDWFKKALIYKGINNGSV